MAKYEAYAGSRRAGVRRRYFDDSTCFLRVKDAASAVLEINQDAMLLEERAARGTAERTARCCSWRSPRARLGLLASVR